MTLQYGSCFPFPGLLLKPNPLLPESSTVNPGLLGVYKVRGVINQPLLDHKHPRGQRVGLGQLEDRPLKSELTLSPTSTKDRELSKET